jgi:hypothetical protein
MDDGILNTNGVSNQRGKQWWRLKLALTFFSVALLASAILMWLRSAMGWIDEFKFPKFGDLRFECESFSGRLNVRLWCLNRENVAYVETWESGYRVGGQIPASDRVQYMRLDLRTSFPTNPSPNSTSRWFIVLEIPYWFSVLVFSIAPTLWLHRHYLVRRDKKLFEEAVASKRAEQRAKEKT